MKIDGLVKSQEFAFIVIPSRIGVRDDGQAEIQSFQYVRDSGFRPPSIALRGMGRRDELWDFLRVHQN